MILSQITPDQVVTGGMLAIATLVLTKVGEWITKYFSYKRQQALDARDRELELLKQADLKRIADSNDAQLKMSARIEANLQYANYIGDERHREILTALQQTCKQKQ